MKDHAYDRADLDGPGEAFGDLVGERAVYPAHVGQDFNDHVQRSAASGPGAGAHARSEAERGA